MGTARRREGRGNRERKEVEEKKIVSRRSHRRCNDAERHDTARYGTVRHGTFTNDRVARIFSHPFLSSHLYIVQVYLSLSFSNSPSPSFSLCERMQSMYYELSPLLECSLNISTGSLGYTILIVLLSWMMSVLYSIGYSLLLRSSA